MPATAMTLGMNAGRSKRRGASQNGVGSNLRPVAASRKGAVIAGFSGQVHFIAYDTFDCEQRFNRPGLLWCIPGSKTGE